MTHALSLDLRRRVTAAISQGKSRRATAAQFLISAATAVRLQKRLEETGSVEPDRVGRPKGSGKLGPYRESIITSDQKLKPMKRRKTDMANPARTSARSSPNGCRMEERFGNFGNGGEMCI